MDASYPPGDGDPVLGEGRDYVTAEGTGGTSSSSMMRRGSPEMIGEGRKPLTMR
jgi:hypothetical protein